ncbi:MAG TPA: hypothetical protein VJA94_08345 [Candidatus Angelobacter sp.]
MRRFTTVGGLEIARRWLTGRFHGIADIYIPYRLYKVTLDDRRIRSVRFYAIDAAVGTLDPYEFARPPQPDSWLRVETGNFHPIRLNEDQTKKFVVEKVRRVLYSRGFFRLANPAISADLIEPEFYLPYWAGFYGDERDVRIIVLNAIRQRVEGSKVRRLVKNWLLEGDSQNELKLAF